MKKFLATALLLGCTAQAVNLDFGVSYPLTARVGVSDWGVLGGRVGAGLSTKGADLSYARVLALPPLGAVSVSSRAQVAWAGGYWLESRGTGALGPVAVNLGGNVFSTPASTFDALAYYILTPTDTRPSGWNADLSVRYRVNRNAVAVLGGEFGGQTNGFAGVELRRDLTRTLPPAEGDDPEAPPETESLGTLTYRLGVRAGRDVLGATAGITYATQSGRTLALDAQLGPSRSGNAGYGVVGSVGFGEVLGDGSSLRAYAAYEPWREYAAPLRVGLEASKPLGRGTLGLNLRGGQNRLGETGFGVSATYSFPLGGSTEQP